MVTWARVGVETEAVVNSRDISEQNLHGMVID